MYRENNFEFMRVGVKYWKVIDKANERKLVLWQRQILSDDYSKDEVSNIIRMMDKYDSFTLEPDNFNWKKSIDNDFNLYHPFRHVAKKGEFPTIKSFMNHIFKEHVELGYKYFKILYQQPKQKLPILVLTSEEEATGKSTFMEFVSYIFGKNCEKTTSTELTGSFNSDFAMANIVTMEEVLMEGKQSVEKIKAIVTDEYVKVSEKFISKYQMKNYAKLIFATNNEYNFAQINGEGTRFWVRKISRINGKDEGYKFKYKLEKEVPAFLHYLSGLPEVESKGRLVFSPEEIYTDALNVVKEHSKGGLYNDLKLKLEDTFLSSDRTVMYATPSIIKDRFFKHDNKIGVSYIVRTLKNDFKLNPKSTSRQIPLDGGEYSDKVNGKHYEFLRENFVKSEDDIVIVKPIEDGAPF